MLETSVTVGANAICTMNTPCLLGKGALVTIMTHAQEFPQDKMKCEVADKRCMASLVAGRKREHQYYLLRVVNHWILETRPKIVKELGPPPASHQRRGNFR